MRLRLHSKTLHIIALVFNLKFICSFTRWSAVLLIFGVSIDCCLMASGFETVGFVAKAGAAEPLVARLTLEEMGDFDGGEDGKSQEEEEEDSGEDPPEVSWEEEFISNNIAISDFVNSVAEGLDLFLAGKRLTNRPNETSVVIENSTYTVDGENTANTTGFGVNLRLPNLEEYWHLKFSNYDEREERGVNEKYLRQTPRENNYGATVGFFKKFGDVRTIFEPRIELQDPLRVSHSLRFDSIAKMDQYTINPKLEFFFSPTKGVGQFLAINFNWPLSKNLTMTFINEGEYQERFHSFSTSNGFSMGHYWSPVTSFSYDLIFNSNNRDVYHLENYIVSTSLNHLVYKKILDYRLTPYLNFRRDKGFAGVTGFVFAVALRF